MCAKTGHPRPLSTAAVRELLSHIASEHGRRFVLEGAFGGGDGPGAWALSSPNGPGVLKVLAGRDATAELELRGRAMEELKIRGYPAPGFLFTGTIPAGTYLIQERLRGEPIGRGFTRNQLDEILRLHALHAEIGIALPGENWPLPVTRPVLEGGDGFCVIETMRAYSSETEELLTELQETTRHHAHEAPEHRDLVHHDFTFANILARDGQVTGVIDWEAAMIGDRGFDLATFAFYVFDDDELRRTLLTRALDVSGSGALRVYLAHIMFRQTEWCTRFYGNELVRFYLRHSRTVLDELARL